MKSEGSLNPDYRPIPSSDFKKGGYPIDTDSWPIGK